TTIGLDSSTDSHGDTAPPSDAAPAKGSVSWHRSHAGEAWIRADRPQIEINDVEVNDEAMRLCVERAGLSDDELATARLTNEQAEVPVADISDNVLVFPTHVSRFGRAPTPLPHGHYWVAVTLADGQVLHADATMDYIDTVPHETSTGPFTTRWTYAKEREARVSVMSRLGYDEKGRWARRRLVDWYQQHDHVCENSVLFQCYRGEFATDSQRV